MLPLCAQKGIGVMPWGSLAQGFLARPHTSFAETTRGASIEETGFLSERNDAYRANGGEEINERVRELSEEKDVSMAQIALAWVLAQDAVDAAIVGTRRPEHVEEAVGALSVDLTDDERTYLEEPYGPVSVVGHA